MVKLSYADVQYLMSFVRPIEDGPFQVKLLAIFQNGFLTSDGFYKEVWANNQPKYDIDMPTVFNAAAALDLPVGWRDLNSHVSVERTVHMPDERVELKFIDIEKALVLGQTIGVVCPSKDDNNDHMVYDYEYTWCILDSKK